MSNCAFNYSGSKSDYTELHAIDEPVVDLFGGGGGFWSMSRSLDVIVNDTNTQLVSFQKLVYEISDDNFEAMVSKLYDITGSVNSREEYEELRDRLNHMQNPVLFMAVLACCTNNMIRYNRSGGFNQTWGKRKFNPSMEKKLREFRSRIRAKKVRFAHGDFRLFPNLADTLYFVDPPYLISGNHYTSWTETDENDLYLYLKNKKFILTNYVQRGNAYNDILRNTISNNNWAYSVLRQGQMRAQKDNSTFVELLVCDSNETMSSIIGKL